MGIPKFHQYILKTYPEACKRKWCNNYDNLYIDINHILYDVSGNAKNIKEVIVNLNDYLRYIIIEVLKPKKRVFIAADGPAPMAKLMEQRRRRLDTVKKLNENDEFKINDNITLNFTPGTKFMKNLEKHIKGLIKYLDINYNLEVITNICEPNEGEIKVKFFVIDIQKKYPNDTHVIFSGDSDMILLLFTCHNLDKIYHMSNKKTIISMGKLYESHITLFGYSDTSKHDFVFLNMLMGNDYFPKVQYLKLENLWNAYRELIPYRKNGLIKYNYEEMEIDSIFFHDLLYVATKNTPKGYLNRFSVNDLKYPYYNDYLKGLYWCFNMYITGTCKDYRYIYDHASSPHVSGIMLKILFNTKYKILSYNPVDTDLYSILLIPEKARSLLTTKQNSIIDKLYKKYPIIYEEGRCEKCRTYAQDISKLNKKRRLLDTDSEERIKLNNKIGRKSKKYRIHKKTHNKITANKIKKIQNYVLKLKEETKDNNYVDDNDNSDEEYIPPLERRKNRKRKKLF